MRTIICIAALSLALISPGMALAVDFVSIDGVADCNGWRADVRVWFWDGARDVRLRYAVVLTDDAGNEVQRFTHDAAVTPIPNGFDDYVFEGSWDAQPGDGWQVNGAFTLVDIIPDLVNEINDSFATTVVCEAGSGDPETPPCAYTSFWWRRHPEAWPAQTLTIGSVELTSSKIMWVLKRPAWGNARLLLARILIAARFNAMLNPDCGMEEAMAAADSYLTHNSPFPQYRRGRHNPRPRRPDLQALRAAAMPLIIFNTSGCPDNPMAQAETEPVSDLELLLKAEEGLAPTEADVSFGALKSMYR
jgi:hypothetical protein